MNTADCSDGGGSLKHSNVAALPVLTLEDDKAGSGNDVPFQLNITKVTSVLRSDEMKLDATTWVKGAVCKLWL